MSEAHRARALGRFLDSRREIDGDGLWAPPGQRAALLARLAELGAPDGGKVGADPAPSRATESLVRLSREGSAAVIESLTALADVRAVAEACVRCGLHETRNSVVFADGSPEARVMCVGEAPGANEDAEGLPFVGRAGKLLDRLLLSVGMPREEVYICNVLKCRPPGNRNPETVEIQQCSPFLRRQVDLVAPDVIVAFGTFAARTLLDVRDSLGRLRDRTHVYQGVPLIVTYHPAALLRNPGWIRPTWEDLQRVRQVLAEADRG